MVYVSVSAYNDASLLTRCLTSIRDHLPDAAVAVVDGRYETWPAAADNSTDATAQVAAAHGATYHADGPFPRERDKHLHRVGLAPGGEWCLMIDADERILDVTPAVFDRDAAFGPRIFNVLTYGPHAVYWPRCFKPEWVVSINSWDAYLFDVPYRDTDDMTLIHRHDLRDRSYRRAKYERFDAEGRVGRYEDAFDTYLSDNWDVSFGACPECGASALTRSQVTNYAADGALSYVEACTNGECYASVERIAADSYRYLPDDWERGFEEDPARLRLELLDAGCDFLTKTTTARMVREFQTVIELWIESNLKGVPNEVFDTS